MRKKPKNDEEYFTLIFVRREEDRYHVVKKKVLDVPKKTIRLGKERSYVVQYDAPTLVHGLNRQYVIDYQTGDQYLLGEGETNPLTPEELDVILGTKIVREIASSVQKDPLQFIIPLVLGILGGFMAGWLISSSIFQEKIDELMKLLFENQIPAPDWQTLGKGLKLDWMQVLNSHPGFSMINFLNGVPGEFLVQVPGQPQILVV